MLVLEFHANIQAMEGSKNIPTPLTKVRKHKPYSLYGVSYLHNRRNLVSVGGKLCKDVYHFP